MLKVIGGLLVVAFVIYFVTRHPAEADAIAQQLYVWFEVVGDALVSFFNHLDSSE